MSDFDSLVARRRALRAARAVTFSASLVGLAACGGGTDTPDAFSPPDASSGTTDAFVAMDDAASASDDAASASDDAASASDDAASASDDAFASAEDAGASDDAYTFTGDAGCGPDFPPTNQPCCELAGGFWDEASSFCAIAVPGPFVPPAMVG